MDREQLLNIRRKIRILKSKQENLREMEKSICFLSSNTFSEKISGGIRQDFTDYINKLLEEKDLLAKEIAEYYIETDEVRKEVKKLNNPIYEQIIIDYYINGKKWEQIAIDMTYDYRWLMRLHKRVLKLLN